MSTYTVTDCPICEEKKEMTDEHDMCYDCWEENGEPHPDSYSVDENGWIVYD